MPARWVYSIKTDQNQKEIYKARLVAKGYSQRLDIDYQETLSPTAKMTSIRILMQIATQYNFMVHQLDVKSAYLNALIEWELYMEQAKGFWDRK